MMIILSTLTGAAVGYAIGKYMSRLGMGCPLLCNPKISTIYFAMIGLLIALK